MSTKAIASPDCTACAAEKPPRRRRWIPLSLKIFLAIHIVVLAVGLAWLGVRGYTNRAAVDEIRLIRGHYETLKRGPNWLRECIGDDWMLAVDDEINSIDLSGTAITDAGLVHISRLPKLQELHLDGTHIGDSGLAHLNDLTSLEILSLSGTRISDSGLANLKCLARLVRLILSNTRVTDAGLAHLKGLSSLREFDLDGTQVTDAGLAQLRELNNLEFLF